MATIMSIVFFITNRSFSSSQQCCYDSNGYLLTGAGGSTAYSVYPNNWKSLIGIITIEFIIKVIFC